MFAPPLPAASFKLPSPSLTEKTLLSNSPPSQLIFPNEFPYEFETFSSPFTSPDDSTENEDETSDDEDDFLAGLTRRLSSQRLSSLALLSNKSEVKSNVSDAALSGAKSPDGPFPQLDSLKVISAAAGEVTKLKNFDSSHSKLNPVSAPVPFPHQNAAYSQTYYYNWLWNPMFYTPFFGTSIYAAPKLPSGGTGVFVAPNAVKTPSTGTGVFLPKIPSDSKKKSGGGSGKSTKKVVQPKNHKTEEVSGQSQASKIDHECLVTFPSLK